MKKLAKVAISFGLSMLVVYIAISTATGYLNSYYWNGLVKIAFILIVVILTFLLYILIEDEA